MGGLQPIPEVTTCPSPRVIRQALRTGPSGMKHEARAQASSGWRRWKAITKGQHCSGRRCCHRAPRRGDRGPAVDFSQRAPGPRRARITPLPPINVASGPPCTDTAGGDGDRTGQKEKEGSDYCCKEACGIPRAYKGQERPG